MLRLGTGPGEVGNFVTRHADCGKALGCLFVEIGDGIFSGDVTCAVADTALQNFQAQAAVFVHFQHVDGDVRRGKLFHPIKRRVPAFGGLSGEACNQIEVDVIDVARVFSEVGTPIACFKLNIEGGEYDVLERMLETNDVSLCESLLIQFHRQPEGFESRYKTIVDALHKTHNQSWSYEMVWEKWVLKERQK